MSNEIDEASLPRKDKSRSQPKPAAEGAPLLTPGGAQSALDAARLCGCTRCAEIRPALHTLATGTTLCKSSAAEAADRARIAELEARLKQGEFWKDVYPDGWTAERVENEMKDYMMLLDGMPELYCHITGGAISKPNTDKQAVMAVSDDHVSELCCQAVEEETEHLNSELTALRKERGDLREALMRVMDVSQTWPEAMRIAAAALAHTENQETK